MRTDVQAAHAAVAAAIEAGQLPTSGDCAACGKHTYALEYHHWSYSAEHRTDVIPLDHSCHVSIHAGSIPEPRTGRMFPRRAPRAGAKPPRFPEWAAWFAPRLDRWMQTNNANQMKFSARTGIELTAVSNYRNGQLRPDPYGDRLPKLADMFGLDAAGVVGMYHAAGVVLPAALASAARLAP